MKPIAICQNKKIFEHSTLWTSRFIEYCKKYDIPFEILDCYSNEIIKQLTNYSALLWHYSNFVIADLLEARNIIQVANNMGLVTFPTPMMNWHFDDKIAEMYALQSVGAEIPSSSVFYIEEECLKWIKNEAQFPLVAKLRCGSGANNVKLLHNVQEAIIYTKKMFHRGFDPTPSFAYKAYSKIQSSKDFSTIIARIKKIPEFINTRSNAKMMPIERGYCYFQEYIPNDGYDLKVIVIGDKMTFCARKIRKHDFRASGGGNCYYDRCLLTDDVIDTAFQVSEKLGMYCVGFDFVVDNRSKKSKIIEMCYGFDYEVQRALGAFVDKNHQWHEMPVIVPDEIVKIVLKKVGVLK